MNISLKYIDSLFIIFLFTGAGIQQALPLPGASQRSAPLPETQENQRRHLQRQRQHGVSICCL